MAPKKAVRALPYRFPRLPPRPFCMPSPDADISHDDRRARRVAAVKRRQRRQRTQRIVGIVIVVVAVGVGAFFFAGNGSDAIPAGVRVEGVDVGGLSAEAATAKLRESVSTDLSRSITLVREDTGATVREVPANTIATGADIEAAVQSALTSRGRVGRAFSRVGLAGTKNIPLTYKLTEDGLNRVTAQANAALTVKPRGATVRVVKQEVVVTPGKSGQRVDRALLKERLSTLPETVKVPITEVAASPTDAEAQRAKKLGDQIRATAREVTLAGRSAMLTPRALTNALRFPAAKGKITVQLNTNVLRSALIAKLGVKESPPRDARITVDGTRATVVPSQLGTRFDAADLSAKIVANPDQIAVTAKVKRAQAAFTTKQAQALKIREKVGEFTTEYACCQNRTVNIQVAAKKINGIILKPGERFSLNERLGERTEAKGYLAAPMIAGEELVDSVGGGVSQVATTVYNAAFFSGLEIITHTPHSFYISRYPKGREATISWGSPDLVFRNDWDAALYIAASASDNAITVAMYSSKLGRRVETETSEPTNPVEPKTIERPNSELAPGTRKVIQSAGPAGFSVSYTRKVYKGKTLHRDETYRWNYRPENAIVEVGPPAPKPPTTTGGDETDTTDQGDTDTEDAAPPTSTATPEATTTP